MHSGILAIFLGMPGLPELMIVAVIVLLLFGKRLPTVMRSLGSSIVEFKRGVKGVEEDIEEQTNSQNKSDQPASPQV